jgi:hypothetical protein
LVEWADALERLVIEMGMFQSDDDRDAFYSFREALLARQRLSDWLGEPPGVVRQADLLAVLDETLQSEPLPGTLDEIGRIRVLAAPSVRALDVPYLFVAGLSEQAFPARQAEDGVLNESERKRLIERGLIRLGTRAEHIRDEMLLFYEVVTRASRRLYLSYPAMNAKAEPMLPSPLLEEVARIFSGMPLESPAPADLSPIPRGERVFCPRDQRVAAVCRALEGDAGMMSGLRAAPPQSQVAAAIARACHALIERRDRDRYGRFEGMLTTLAARDELRKRFGPECTFSASRLEDYAACPFRFWLTDVLGIEPPTELALEEDGRTRGLLLHGAMAQAHRRLNELSGGPTSPCRELSSQFIAGFQEALAAVLDTIGRDDPLDAAFRRIDHDLLCELVERYVEQFERYADEFGQSLLPSQFEVEFGLKNEDAAPGAAGPLVLGDGDDAVRLAGRIDRIDVGAIGGRPVFGVVDYKSGKGMGYKPDDDHVTPTRMQLEIYALAVETLLLSDAAPVGCGYWFVGGKGHKTWLDLRQSPDSAAGAAKTWQRRKEQLIATILGLARSIRDGQFPMHNDDEHCTSRCDFHKTCRVNHARALQKKWSVEQ